MRVASHYIFRDMLGLIERRNLRGLDDICDTYSKRYKDDHEFQEVCNQISQYITPDKNEERMDDIKDRIIELINVRKINQR